MSFRDKISQSLLTIHKKMATAVPRKEGYDAYAKEYRKHIVKESHYKKGTLFGKPRSEVVKHPGAFSAAAHKAGKSTSEYAQEKKHAGGTIGHRARLALVFAKMRAKRK
jgi:hypothetical protein